MELHGNGAWYLRVSLDEEKQDVASQRGQVERWLQANELTVKPQHRYEDQEGYTPRHAPEIRPQWMKLQQAIKSGLVQWIIVADQNRIGGKDEWHYASIVHDFRTHGIRVFTVDGVELTGDGALAFFTGGIKAGASREELNTKSKAVIRGKREKAIAGEWQGGYVPYALDVVCFGENKKEKWRLRWHGHFQRERIWPDGKSERYDGKGNLPATENKDVLMLQPGEPSRVKTAQWIFETYATQSISPYQIAKSLNGRGIKQTYNDTWLGSHVSDILRNQAYMGKPAWNKSCQAVYYTDDGKETKPVQNRKQTKKQKTAWYFPAKPIFTPIIREETWNDVQKKLEKPVKSRAPKTQEIWLAGLVHCAHCHVRMRGQARTNYIQFLCQTGDKARMGKKVTCLRNSVHQEMIEEILDQYLADVGVALDTLIGAEKEPALLDTLKEEFDGCFKLYVEASSKMAAMVFPPKVNPDPIDSFLGGWNMPKGAGKTESFIAMYKAALEGKKPQLENDLAKLDADHNALMNTIGRFQGSPRALAKLQDQLMDIEAKMDQAEAAMTDHSETWQQQKIRTQEIRQAIATVQEEKPGLRAKSEALGKIIARIEVTFKPTGKKYPQAVPEFVTIIPHTGKEVRYAASS